MCVISGVPQFDERTRHCVMSSFFCISLVAVGAADLRLTLYLLVNYMFSLRSEELQRLNNLRDENIFEGDVLAVSAASAGTGCTTAAKSVCVIFQHTCCPSTKLSAETYALLSQVQNIQGIGLVGDVPIDYSFQDSVRVSNELWELEVQNRLLDSSLQLAA